MRRRSSKSSENWKSPGFFRENGKSDTFESNSFTYNILTASGRYLYKLKQIDTVCSFGNSQVTEAEYTSLSAYGLDQYNPNLFNPSTKISFAVPKTFYVSLEIYSVPGIKPPCCITGQYTAEKLMIFC